MTLLSSTELQECGHPANFCHECEGDLNTCGFNGVDHGPVMVTVVMDEWDWNFVIDCLRHRARREPTTSDTAERATFTADSIQDVLSSL
jgi:hypothetical protein